MLMKTLGPKIGGASWQVAVWINFRDKMPRVTGRVTSKGPRQDA